MLEAIERGNVGDAASSSEILAADHIPLPAPTRLDETVVEGENNVVRLRRENNISEVVEGKR